jgi:hypothetical protein
MEPQAETMGTTDANHSANLPALPLMPPTNTDNATPHDNTLPTGDIAHAFDKAGLLRQVEYYFSDENLQQEAHLLGKLEEGNGSVSIAQINERSQSSTQREHNHRTH